MKQLFRLLAAPALFCAALLFTPVSYATGSADARLTIQTGTPLPGKTYDRSRERRIHSPPRTSRITGSRDVRHPPRHRHHRPPAHFHPDYRYHKRYHGYRPPYLSYRSGGLSFRYVAPLVYSAPVIRSEYPVSPRVVVTAPRTATSQPQAAHIDAWAALSRYQTHQAIHGFKIQSRQSPGAALPKVGYALATAIDGEYDKAVWAMQIALRDDPADLQDFTADADLKLMLEELRLYYTEDAFMTASLSYLLRDFNAAQQAVEHARSHCSPCTSVEHLAGLLDRQ